MNIVKPLSKVSIGQSAKGDKYLTNCSRTPDCFPFKLNYESSIDNCELLPQYAYAIRINVIIDEKWMYLTACISENNMCKYFKCSFETLFRQFLGIVHNGV